MSFMVWRWAFALRFFFGVPLASSSASTRLSKFSSSELVDSSSAFLRIVVNVDRVEGAEEDDDDDAEEEEEEE